MYIKRRTLLKGIGGVAVCRALRSTPAFGKADRPSLKLGQIGTTHAHASKLAVYRQSSDYEVVGVVETSDERWEAVRGDKAYLGLPRLTEEQLLSTPGLSAVTVETDVEHLVPCAMRCISAGLHVHLDKPAGADLPAFASLLNAAEAKGRMVQLGYMLRYSPATALLRRLMEGKALGEVFEVTAVMSKVVPPADRAHLARFSGGMMFELGCHVVDLVVGLLGKPDKITAYPRSVVKTDGLADSMLAVFEYPNATATVRSSAVEVDGGVRRQFVVCGTGGTLRTEPLEPPSARLSLAEPFAEFKKGTHEVRLPKYARYVADAADMAAVIRGDKPTDYPYAHDRLVHECLLRAAGMPPA